MHTEGFWTKGNAERGQECFYSVGETCIESLHGMAIVDS
jgi:hypothetical protein